ncbi:MAG: class I SAM-dependent methyltransferase [Roseiflexaceae bacterium]
MLADLLVARSYLQEERAGISMSVQALEDRLGRELPLGSRHYRAWVGPTHHYDLMSATQFNLLTFLGLREDHYLLDLGCGSLRGGKLFLAYLLPGHYFGIEPEQWAIEEGIQLEVGKDLIDIKLPTFSNDRNFTLSIFNREFDFILAQSILSHTSQAQIKRVLSEAKKVMKPSSVFAATFLQGDHNYIGEGWVYPECISYTQEYMVQLVEEQGLSCRIIPWKHPNQQTWMVIVRQDYQGNILESADQLPFLRTELDACKERLALIQQHPYVKFGMAVKALLQKVKKAGK